uniref:Uncharacterized protein n=1 Tax=Eutreptiella gymnastica TaxID=73025 RepID=A0A7S4FXG8_9EUGL|mmetsp:Transcript_79857/g.133393  ORF Transcript_79857/g.133393 Transcript_79857/m.133393 type:complete len:100 (-) Transcript_79857:1161-1460(-)
MACPESYATRCLTYKTIVMDWFGPGLQLMAQRAANHMRTYKFEQTATTCPLKLLPPSQTLDMHILQEENIYNQLMVQGTKDPCKAFYLLYKDCNTCTEL